ncbi:hypothetical protein M5K25_010371 [Dendrobium thyrsiflorum]|uniref:Uncharacterized protein n=1 Tax=Dendrobium thyrsiflorum TaxID=117978 RepID=A0ABD0V752_DENTH
MLLATGPKAFLMALALPLGQSAISLAIDKLWGGSKEGPRTSRPRIRRKPFSTSYRKEEQDESTVKNKRKADYQSWVAAESGSDYVREKDSERPSFGGWDELDQQRRQVRWQPPRAESSSKSAQVKMGKLSKKGRYSDAPLFLRLLIAVFPFLGSWIRIL